MTDNSTFVIIALQSPRVPEPTSIENVVMEDTWLREKIGIALGEASMCWSEIPTGVFHSECATEILNDLCCQINTRKSPRVPVIEGLDEAIKAAEKYRDSNGEDISGLLDYESKYGFYPHLAIEKAARAYAELQKGA